MSSSPKSYLSAAIGFVSFFGSIGGPMVFPSTPLNGVIIIVVGITISIPCFILAYALRGGYRTIKDIFPKKRTGKMMVIIGGFLILVGLVIVISQLNLNHPVKNLDDGVASLPTTTVATDQSPTTPTTKEIAKEAAKETVKELMGSIQIPGFVPNKSEQNTFFTITKEESSDLYVAIGSNIFGWTTSIYDPYEPLNDIKTGYKPIK